MYIYNYIYIVQIYSHVYIQLYFFSTDIAMYIYNYMSIVQIYLCIAAIFPAVRETDNARCHACGKCYVCKQSFLSPCSKFSCHHSKQVFPINKYITCQSNNLIYLMECRTYKQSYVGYTTSNLPKRFSNHKSHIKKGIRSCKLENHFLDIDHDLDFSTTASYNSSLRTHLSVIKVDAIYITIVQI